MPQQDEWKPIGGNDWVPITPPKPLDTRLKDPITLQPKTNVVEPFKGMPLSTLEGIRLSGPPVQSKSSYTPPGMWQGVKDATEELYHHVASTGKSSAEKLMGGDIPGALHDVFTPITAPFEHATKGVANVAAGKPPFDVAPDIKEQTWQGVNTVGSVVGLPGQAFREAWEHSDYPRLAGQAIGAAASFAIPHYVGNKLRNYDISVEGERPPSTSFDIEEPSMSEAFIGPHRNPIKPDMQSDLYDLGYSQSDINALNPNQAREIITNQTEYKPTVDSAFTRAMRAKTRDDSLSTAPPPTEEIGAPSSSSVPRTTEMEPVPYTAGQDLSWPEKPSTEVVNQLASEGMEPYQDNQGNWFFRLVKEQSGHFEPGVLLYKLRRLLGRDPTPDEINAEMRKNPTIVPPGIAKGAENSWPQKASANWGESGERVQQVVSQQDAEQQAARTIARNRGVLPTRQVWSEQLGRFIYDESGHLDPTLLWKNVRRYFDNPDPPENVNDWRTALIRAAAAGDMEATSIINARVRELEQQTASPRPDTVIDQNAQYRQDEAAYNASQQAPDYDAIPRTGSDGVLIPRPEDLISDTQNARNARDEWAINNIEDYWNRVIAQSVSMGDQVTNNHAAEVLRALQFRRRELGVPSVNQPVRTMADHVAEAEAAGATPRQTTPSGESDIQYYDRAANRLEIEDLDNETDLRHLIEYWMGINSDAYTRGDADVANHSGEMVNLAEERLLQIAPQIMDPYTNMASTGTPQELPSPAPVVSPTTAAPSIQINYLWEGWDLQDRWHDLRESARAAGDDTAVEQAQQQIDLLDQQMDIMRNQPRDARTPVTVTDPSIMEGANAHLAPPATPSAFGAQWSAAARTPPTTIRTSPQPINTPFSSLTRPYAAPDVIRQQMQDLGIGPEREQWYRSLNNESLEFPEEGNQPRQPTLGLDEEIDPVTGLTSAQISELDPNFVPKEYVAPEGEGRYQPKLKLREEPWYTEADIDELEQTMNSAANNGLGLSYGTDQLRNLPSGRPGLEVKSSGGTYFDAIYRDANGRPVATASGSTRGISNLGAEVKKPRSVGATTQENKGIGTGRPVYAVLRGLIKKGVPLRVNSSLSPYSKAMVQSFIKMARRVLQEETGAVDINEAWENIKSGTGWGMGRSGDTPFKFSDVIEGRAKVKEETPNNPFKEVVTLPTVATTVSDMSGPGRQGLSQILTPEFWKAGKDMFRGAWTPELFDKVDAEVRNLPLFKEYRDPTTAKIIPSKGEKMGIKISAPGHRLGPREEGTASRWIETGGMFGPETIKGWNNPVRSTYKHTLGVGARISNRGLTTFLNVLRANRAQKLMDLAAGMANEGMRTGSMPMEGVLGGMKMPDFLGGEHLGFKQKVSMEEAAEKNPYLNDVLAREIGDFINTATGRGPLKTHILPFKQAELSLEGAADKLGYALFSPRNFAAKARMMNPSTYVMASPFVRKQYLKAILSTGMAWYTFTELAKLADPEVEVNYDPTNADFGKVRIGDFRMDPAGGFQQFLVLYSRMMAGGSTSSASERFRKFGSGPTAETMGSTMLRFGSNKLNPVARFAWDFAFASKRQPFQVMDRTMQMYLPLVAQDAYEIYKEDPDLFPWLLPIAHGWGSQIYGNQVNQGRFIDKKNDFTITGGGPMDWFGMNK